MPSLLDQARDRDYWKQLNPHLTISDPASDRKVNRIHLDKKVLDGVNESLKTKGYFQLDELLDVALIDLLGAGVHNIWKSGWPTPFSMVYDEYWQLYHSLEELWIAVLGPGYKQVPNFWCWYVDKTRESKGWGPHRDRPAVSTVLPDGSLTTLTCWIPFAEATTANGCIYVLPADRDPNFPFNLESIAPTNMQDIRALPARRGSVLGWSEALVHWGSRSSEEAERPRISLSFTYQRGDKPAYETPLFDPLTLPTFEFRLGFIAQNVERYQMNAATTDDILSVCSRLSSNIAPLQIPEGFERQTVEVDQRLSKSALWSLQEEYLERVRAGQSQDSEVTPAPLTTFLEIYSEQLLAFLLDYASDLDFAHPLYILELGGGAGNFACALLSKLLEALQQFEKLKKLELRYVVSDSTRDLLKAACENKKLEPFKNIKILDFAAFRGDHDTPLQLIDSRDLVGKEHLKNPLIVIANCVFDTMKHDAFRSVKGALQETRFTFYRDGRQHALDTPIQFDEVQSIERFGDIGKDYYDDPVLNSILEYYANSFEQASFLLPVGALQSIANLAKLSGNKLVLMAAAKGFTRLDRLRGLTKHQFASPRKFSFDVNFDAVARYVEAKGGTSFHEAGDAESVCTFTGVVLDGKRLPLDHLKHYFSAQVSGKDPINTQVNSANIIRQVLGENNDDHRSLIRTIASISKLSNFAPDVFVTVSDKYFETISEDLKQLDGKNKDDLVDMLKHIELNTSGDRALDVLDRVFKFYVKLERYDECLELLKESLERYGPSRTILDHFALCYEMKKEYALAHDYFQKSLELDPEHGWARAGLNRMKKKLPKVTGKSFSVSLTEM